MLHKPKKERGLRKALLYDDGYGNWGWWCPDLTCSPDADNITGDDHYTTREGARKAAHRHEGGVH